MIAVALTKYDGGERTMWVWMPAVPRIGETVFAWGRYYCVRNVYWSIDNPGHENEWTPEVHLGA